MKILIIVFALILVSIYFAVSTPTEAYTPNESERMMTIDIECPSSIKTGILNVPQGWSPLVAPGAARINFQEVILSKENGRPKIGCFYSNEKGEFALHQLHQTMPANYTCKVAQPVSETKFRRLVTCSPRIITKKN